MTRYINLVFILTLLVNLSCGHNGNLTKDKNYTLPVQKNQPRLLYPKTAQENSFTGNSKLLFQINKTGTVDKVNVVRSSGSELLDNAAVEYCKNLLFYPATRNGEPTPSVMSIEIKFHISNQDMDAFNYVQNVNWLYKKLLFASPSERNMIEKEILEKHNQFIVAMRDGINFNKYVAQVILPSVLAEWKRDWNAWPLSFLLYHDFIQRFPDYDSIASVKNLLHNAVKYDMEYIKNTPTYDSKSTGEKEDILMKIRGFIANHYPDIKIEEIGIAIKIKSEPLS